MLHWLPILLASLTPFALFTNPPSNDEQYRAAIRHVESGGIGYETGYTTVEAFLASDPDQWAFTPFFDARGHVFDSGRWALNAGTGVRTMWGQRAYGINAYYDFRNTHRLNYNQVGIGLETLGETLDFRLNGYLPVGKKVSAPWSAAFDTFSGHTMLITQKYQFAMRGADAEIGYHFGETTPFDFYAAAGPYYYHGDLGTNTWGGKVRIRGMYKEILSLELMDSYDNTFHNKLQGEIGLNFSFGPKSKVKNEEKTCERPPVLTCRMVQPVERQEIIVLDKKRKRSKAIDPATGLPYFFVFVNNTSSSNGTFESPYPTLALAQANSKPHDVIYVFPGDGTTTGMADGIALQASQKFWGSGYSHSLETAQGNIEVPAQSSSSPSITNTAGDTVTLATNNEVSGFMMSSPFNYGITGVNPQDILISYCTITDSLADLIHLEYSAAAGNISLSQLTLISGEDSQIFITSTSPNQMNLSVASCLFQTSTVFPISFTCANAAAVTLTNNQFLNNTNGTFFTLNGTSTLAISNNIFQGQTSVSSQPIVITAESAPISVTVANSLFNNNETGSIRVGYTGTAATELTIINNTFSNNRSGAIDSSGSNIVIDPNTYVVSSCSVSLTGNTFSTNSKNCFFIPDSGAITDLNVIASANSFSNPNSGGTALAFASPCTTFNLNATNNTISGLHDNGISTVGSTPMQTANITISNNTITGIGNNSNAIALSQGSTTLNFTAENNILSDCTGTGILCFASGGFTNMNANITGNVISNCQNIGDGNAASGISLDTYGHLTSIVANNTFSNNAARSVGVGINSSGDPTVCLTLTGNSSDSDPAYSLSNPGSGAFNLSPCNVESVNTGTFAESGTITPVQSCPAGAACP